MKIELTKQKHKPGNVVQRFGNWRKGEPTVIIDNERWVSYGKPENITVVVETEKESKEESSWTPCWCNRIGCGGGNQCGYGAAG